MFDDISGHLMTTSTQPDFEAHNKRKMVTGKSLSWALNSINSH